MNFYKKFSLGAVCAFAAVALNACGDNGASALDNECPDGGPCYEYDSDANTMKDLRDNKVYATVEIGKQIWMAENIGFSMKSESWCYNKSTSHCEKYGLLYTWEAAKVVCPDGWHLPSDDEWMTLFDQVGGTSHAGDSLKSTEEWKDHGDGVDSYGFTVLPGGYRDTKGKYYLNGEYALIWTATAKDKDNAYVRRFAYDESSAGRSFDSKQSGMSVRCLKNSK